MKRFIALIIGIVLVVGLAGCGNPDGASDEGMEAAKKAIAVADDFLDDRIDKKTAYDRVKELEEKISENEEDRFIWISMSGLTTSLIGFPLTSTTTDVLESRNELAKKIREKQRKKD